MEDEVPALVRTSLAERDNDGCRKSHEMKGRPIEGFNVWQRFFLVQN